MRLAILVAIALASLVLMPAAPAVPAPPPAVPVPTVQGPITSGNGKIVVQSSSFDST